MEKPGSIRIILFSVVVGLAGSFGCTSTAPDRAVRMTRGYVYFLDGAGGGGALKNYSGGVRQGLVDAGYDGAGEMFTWQTGLGVGADQIASESYKRGKARQLAKRIDEYQREHPNAPVTLIGLSAGTVIAVYALEELPEGASVDTVILLAGSLSADYKLTNALQRVRGKLYSFSSEKDAMLRFLLPLAGTADRARGTNATIGLAGVRMPSDPSAETRLQYQKLVEVPWNDEFKDYGHYGGHTDPVKAAFVQAVLAPLVMAANAQYVATAADTAGEVENPEFAAWARFGAGSWALFEGFEEVDGRRELLRVTVTLVSRFSDRLFVRRAYEALGASASQPPANREFFVTSTIDASGDPRTHPEARISTLPKKAFTLAGRSLECAGVAVQCPASFPEWGTGVDATIYSRPDIPGGIVKLDLRTHTAGRAVRYDVDLADYHIQPDARARASR
jgi:pimeloyl-ACP methyl ester carboxylesterase